MHALLAEAESISSLVIALRRRIHRRPERGLHLPLTQKLITESLDELDIEYQLGDSLSSVVGVILGSEPGPDVILRAEMDALPLHEHSGVSFMSEIDGTMHACGHDTHVAMLLGAARLLAGRRDQFRGRVILMFQPGEEGFAGANLMLEEGLLADVDRINCRAFAIHITTAFPAGTIHLRPGPILAAPDEFEITVQGRGGHASEPHRTLDPIPIAAEIIMALQTMVTRRVSVFDPAVLSVTRMAAGTTHNVVPDDVVLGGTIRTLSESTRTTMHELTERVVGGILAAHGGTGGVQIRRGYPPTVNDPALTDVVHDTAVELLGDEAVNIMASPRMGGEDFSYVLQQVPGVMAFLGGRPNSEDPLTAPMNHSSKVVFDEAILSRGVALHVAFVLRVASLQQAQSE